MTNVTTAVVTAISEICSVDAKEISGETHIFDDLGVDSLDFLDVVFELDRQFGVKLPIEEWLGKAEAEGGGRQLFVVSNFVDFVENALAQRSR